MGREAPMWKGTLISRTYVKDMIRAAFKRAAKGSFEEEVGALTNDLERYMAAELLLNTKEVMQGVVGQLTDATKFLEEMAEGIDEKIIQRRAQAQVEGEEEKE